MTPCIAMITGDWIGTDVLGTGHTYPKGSTIGISDDDSPSVATDYGPPANPSFHRWTVQLPSVAGQLVKAGKDWRAEPPEDPVTGANSRKWPSHQKTGQLHTASNQ